MPKGVPKDKVTKEDVLKLVDAIEALEKRLLKLENKETVQEVKEQVKVETITKPVENVSQSETPVPLEWRQVVEEVLNTKFPIEVKYLDGGLFELTINVPKEYSNAHEFEWQMNKSDRRIKIMNNFLGANGVREYCELISKNLGPDIMRKVQEDKSKVNA